MSIKLISNRHTEITRQLMLCKGVRAEVARIESEERHVLDALLSACEPAGLTQAQVAERMGKQAPFVARLERAQVTGKHSPSIAMLRKYAQACGKQLRIQLV